MEGRLSLVRKSRRGVGPLEKESVYGEMSHGVQSVAAKTILVTLERTFCALERAGDGGWERRGQRAVLKVLGSHKSH